MIQAKIVADSLTERGHRLTTMEVVMPRYILAEFNTHRMLSKNSASSRAIPFNKMVKSIQDSPFVPYAWQKDHKGMQGTEYLENSHLIEEATRLWLKARDNAVMSATLLNGSVGGKAVTKQLVNRLLEPFMYHKVLVSGTEWENFFSLRSPQYQSGYKVGSPEEKDYKVHKSWKDLYTDFVLNGIDSKVCQTIKEKSIVEKLQTNKGQADIHMMFLAEAIYDAIKESTPTKLKDGEWHIPFSNEMDLGKLASLSVNKDLSILELIQRISISRCARLSYQTLGDNPVIDYEKDLALYESLTNSGHASPTEHVAKAMTESEYNDYTRTKPEYDYEENYYKGKKVEKGWCRNYRGFIMYRELLD